MCLIDNAEQINAASGRLMTAKNDLAHFEECAANDNRVEPEFLVSLTAIEARDLYTQRLERAEASLKALLYTKAAPADPADAQRLLTQVQK